MPSRSTNQESIRACFKAQESSAKIDDDFVDDLGDLSAIEETDEDAIVALDRLVLDDIDDAPSLATPVPAVSYVDRQRAYCAALDAECAAADRAIHFAPLHDSFSTEEGERIRREVEAQADDLLSDLDDIRFDDEPVPVTAPPIDLPDDLLGDLDLDAGDESDPLLDVDDEAAIERLEAVTAIYTPAWKDAARIWHIKDKAGKEAQKKQVKAFAQRKKEITAARRLIANRERMALRRASPAILRAKRLTALLKLTAMASGNRFLEKIVGREAHVVQFRDAMAIDTDASLSKLADIYERLTGDPMTKRQAQNRRDIVEKLEAKGGIWHRWK